MYRLLFFTTVNTCFKSLLHTAIKGCFPVFPLALNRSFIQCFTSCVCFNRIKRTHRIKRTTFTFMYRLCKSQFFYIQLVYKSIYQPYHIICTYLIFQDAEIFLMTIVPPYKLYTFLYKNYTLFKLLPLYKYTQNVSSLNKV